MPNSVCIWNARFVYVSDYEYQVGRTERGVFGRTNEKWVSCSTIHRREKCILSCVPSGLSFYYTEGVTRGGHVVNELVPAKFCARECSSVGQWLRVSQGLNPYPATWKDSKHNRWRNSAFCFRLAHEFYKPCAIYTNGFQIDIHFIDHIVYVYIHKDHCTLHVSIDAFRVTKFKILERLNINN